MFKSVVNLLEEGKGVLRGAHLCRQESTGLHRGVQITKKKIKFILPLMEKAFFAISLKFIDFQWYLFWLKGLNDIVNK